MTASSIEKNTGLDYSHRMCSSTQQQINLHKDLNNGLREMLQALFASEAALWNL